MNIKVQQLDACRWRIPREGAMRTDGLVFADRQNHELEDNMVWRIAELIGVSSRDRTVLRNQIRGKAGEAEA